MKSRKTLEKLYDLNISKSPSTILGTRYDAFRGGNGTGEPIVYIAWACSLETLEIRIKRALNGNPIKMS